MSASPAASTECRSQSQCSSNLVSDRSSTGVTEKYSVKVLPVNLLVNIAVGAEPR